MASLFSHFLQGNQWFLPMVKFFKATLMGFCLRMVTYIYAFFLDLSIGQISGINRPTSGSPQGFLWEAKGIWRGDGSGKPTAAPRQRVS
ncbi:hypothetical protein [Rhodoferax sediminis]|jgi:hypothetical protein|uniref:Uncharacterized protein n=1 Tax=Rhodoferax sediminis TaxID=2509614 RepID=A0A515D9W9_9BURK|nr:hypothetical protein [Rhodoferax sediminis]QDL37184.1 hypothetical protein EUB48_07705 [Rhodoferax sediminis]